MSTIAPALHDDKTLERLKVLESPEFKFWEKQDARYIPTLRELLIKPTPPVIYEYEKEAIRRRAPVRSHLYYLVVAEYLSSETKQPFIDKVNELFSR